MLAGCDGELWVAHPGLTVTVEDPEALAALLRQRTSLG